MPARIRWTAYAGVSTALASGVIFKALAQRPNFYSAAVYLSQSSANLMILTNLVFVIACTVLFGLQKLLYGPLRPIEIEQLYEKAWFAVTETCLAMTIFRGEIGAWFLIMFFALLAGKVWGWIGEGRVEVLEQQPPRNPRLFHTRLALSLGLGVCFDIIMLEYVVNQVMRMARPDMMVMFGFEFAVLSISSLSTAARYAVDLVEIKIVRDQKTKRIEEMRKERVEAAQRAAAGDAPRPISNTGDQHTTTTESTEQPSTSDASEAIRVAELPIDENEVEVEGWEGKGKWMFYLDLTTDFLKLIVYLSFFVILLVFYGLPIHIMRDLFLTCRSFFKRISDFVKYRTATRDMNQRYPDATVEDVGREDVCIICREEMRPYEPAAPLEGGQAPPPNPVAERMRPKKLPCGHVLHFSCLRSWLERQQICPTCRTPVVPSRQTGTAGAPGQPGLQPGAQGHPPGGQVGARVFQWGPLRIGVGAARGVNMFEELQQRLANDRGAAPAAAANNGAPRQYGFGLRWEGGFGRRRTARRTSPHGTIRERLNAIEQQIQHEMSNLSQASVELGLLRAMQDELERIRAQRAGTESGVNPLPATATTQSGNGVGLPSFVQPGQLPQRRVQRPTGFQVNPNGAVIHAGSEQLPAGLTLPEGWSMLPLQPTTSAIGMSTHMPFPQPPFIPPNFMPQAWNQPNGMGTAGGFAAPPMQVPDHIRAMFPNMPGQTVNHTENQPTATQQINTGAPAPATESINTPTQGMNVLPTAVDNVRRSAHEQWLASLRNNQPNQPSTPHTETRNGNTGPIDQPNTRVNGESQLPSEPVHSTQSQAAQENTTPSIPLWGSNSVASQAEPATRVENTSATSNSVQHEDNEVSPHSSERRVKKATVEDLVEDPD